jgi:hypothetical protein
VLLDLVVVLLNWHYVDAVAMEVRRFFVSMVAQLFANAFFFCSPLEQAATWLLDESNLPEIIAASMSFEASNTATPTSSTTTTSNDTDLKRKRSDDDDDDDVDARKPSDTASSSSSSSSTTGGMRRAVSSSRLALLEEENLNGVAARYALELFAGDAALARDWLSDADNRRQIDAIVAADRDAARHYAQTHAATASFDASRDSVFGASVDNDNDDDNKDDEEADTMRASQASLGLIDAGVGELVLLNLLDTPAGQGASSVLYRLATLLARVEDLSHVLCWTTTSRAAEQLSLSASFDGSMELDATACRISVVELPRLKLRMQPQVPRGRPDQPPRLYLLDHAGWYNNKKIRFCIFQPLNLKPPRVGLLPMLSVMLEKLSINCYVAFRIVWFCQTTTVNWLFWCRITTFIDRKLVENRFQHR